MVSFKFTAHCTGEVGMEHIQNRVELEGATSAFPSVSDFFPTNDTNWALRFTIDFAQDVSMPILTYCVLNGYTLDI